MKMNHPTESINATLTVTRAMGGNKAERRGEGEGREGGEDKGGLESCKIRSHNC